VISVVIKFTTTEITEYTERVIEDTPLKHILESSEIANRLLSKLAF
jgi:hypothetical protein